jgi:hypothetical protein
VSVNGQAPEVTYVDGTAIVQVGEGFLLAAQQKEKRVELIVLFENIGSSAITFDPKDFVLVEEDYEMTAESKEDWLSYVEASRSKSSFWMAIASGLSSAGSSISSGSSAYSGTSTYSDPAAQQRTAAQNSANMARISSSYNSIEAYWKDMYLGKTTVFPGDSAIGRIIIRAYPRVDYTIRVGLGLETVIFRKPQD